MAFLVKMDVDYGRMGNVDGLFFVDKQRDLTKHFGKEVYFGEILGKHSEVYFTLEPDMFYVTEIDDSIKDLLVNATGGYYTISGYNPLEFIKDE